VLSRQHRLIGLLLRSIQKTLPVVANPIPFSSMPRSRKSRPSSSRRNRKLHGGVYHSPQEQVFTPATLAEQALITPFRSQMPVRYSFRFGFNSAVAYTTGFTTTMLLDMYCVAVGGSASPARMFNNMKLIGLKLWQPGGEAYDVGSMAGIEFSPSTTAGFGGAPRVPHVANATVSGKYSFLAVQPKKDELASQWFSAQQANYVLWNMQCYPESVLQIDVLATMVNGETPVACAYSTSVAKGTVGVTNFGVAGCRSIGLENLVNP